MKDMFNLHSRYEPWQLRAVAVIWLCAGIVIGYLAHG